MIRAVWLVRSHQIAAELRYWLTFIGYDKRDHSLSHKLYLGYATVFFAAWGFASLTLLASFAGKALVALGSQAYLPATAAGVLALALLIWFFNLATKAGHTSPIKFTDEDATLVCQTPAPRPAVALFWLLGEWIKAAPLFWALAVTLAFALQDASFGANAVPVEAVPRYVIAGLRALLVVAPLQLGLMALVWTWGALRLQGGRARRYWQAIPVAASLALLTILLAGRAPILALGCAAPGACGELQGALPLAPLITPLAAAYGLFDWGAGLLIAIAWAAVGCVVLGLAARRLNLSRAAQESAGRDAANAAAFTGNTQAAAEIRLRRHLGAGHAPTRLVARPGWPTLAWRAALAMGRRGWWSSLGTLVMLFSAGLGVALAPDLGSRAFSTLAWVIIAGPFCVAPLQDDLRLWALFRGLPLPTRRAVLSAELLPAALVILTSWLSLLVAALLAAPVGALLAMRLAPLPAAAMLVVPGAALAAGLAAAVDVARASRSGRLLAGSIPLPGTSAVLLGALACALVALAAWFMGGDLLGFSIAALVAALAAYLLLDWAAYALQNVE